MKCRYTVALVSRYDRIGSHTQDSDVSFTDPALDTVPLPGIEPGARRLRVGCSA